MAFLCIFFANHGNASHLLGGQITWECAGQDYIFTLKLYKDCGTSSGGTGSLGTSQNIAISGGGHNINSLNLPLVNTNDLTPTCNSYQTNKLTCPGSPSSSGTMLEFIYRSDTINLSGTIPSTGWTFSWSSCCRPANLAYGANSNFFLRSKIFPYPSSSNARPCIDNSPDFASKPSHVYCIGYPFTYNNSAFDIDGDSLVSKWAAPWSANNTSIPYSTPYTVNNQFPGNPQLNPISGSISVNNTNTIGTFPTAIVAESWKCNKKVAEVYRDIPIIFSNGCGKLNNGTSNNTSPSFYINNIPVSTTNGYVDTITEGDRICFRITAADYDINPNPNDTNGTFQNVTIEPSGNQFGFPINDSTNCKLPPCATLTHPTTGGYPTLTGISAAEAMFCWQTDCIHSNLNNNNCFKKYYTYNFIIKAYDDFCPVPGINFYSVTIVIKSKLSNILKRPLLRCADILPNGNISLSWDTLSDTLNSFRRYEIYYSKNSNGNFLLIDSVLNNKTYNYIDTSQSRNANNGTGFYYIIAKYQLGNCLQESEISNKISPIILNSFNGQKPGEIFMYWNFLTNPLPLSSTGYYYILKELSNNNWGIIDSTSFHSYTDSVCNDTVRYKIQVIDSTGCISNSSITSAYYKCTNTSINEISNSNFNIYPNPTTSLLNIEHTKGSKPYDIIIFNSLGQTVYRKNNITTTNLQVDTKNFKPGVLFIKISSENEASHFKIIKQ